MTAHYLYAPPVHRIESHLLTETDPLWTRSHLLRSTTIIQRRSSLPRNTGFHELGTPCRPRALVHHQIDIFRSSNMYTYTVKVLEISTSKFWKFVHCTQSFLTLLHRIWWWPPQRPKHVVASYLHHIANKLTIIVFMTAWYHSLHTVINTQLGCHSLKLLMCLRLY
jgi:hypothetical protein